MVLHPNSRQSMGNFSHISNNASSIYIHGLNNYVYKLGIRGITLTLEVIKYGNTITRNDHSNILFNEFRGIYYASRSRTWVCARLGLNLHEIYRGLARQPEMLPALRIQMFITAGLMESFPFIVLAFAMFFVFANPFIGAAKAALGA